MSLPINMQEAGALPSLASRRYAMAARFQQAGLSTAALDARVLVAAACCLSPTQLLLEEARGLQAREAAKLDQWQAQILAGMPVSRVLGRREFYGASFMINPHVLDPRPDSEVLVDAVLEHHADESGRLLDLGIGSGCLLLSVLTHAKNCTGIGVDCSVPALEVAQANADYLGVRARLGLRQGYWGQGLDEKFNVIMCNPPYIARAEIAKLARGVRVHDPIGSLDGGRDGLAAYRALMRDVARLLVVGGHAYFEIGMTQSRAVRRIVQQAGLHVRDVRSDLAGRARLVIVQKN